MRDDACSGDTGVNLCLMQGLEHEIREEGIDRGRGRGGDGISLGRCSSSSPGAVPLAPLTRTTRIGA